MRNKQRGESVVNHGCKVVVVVSVVVVGAVGGCNELSGGKV